MSRRFTLWEAERTLPQIREWMREAVAMKSQYDEAEQAVQSLATRVSPVTAMVTATRRERRFSTCLSHRKMCDVTTRPVSSEYGFI